MKPLGRKPYMDKTGGKHKHKIEGKTYAWWINMIPPNKTKEKQEAQKEIQQEIINN